MNLPQVWWNNDLRARESDLGQIWVKEWREIETKTEGVDWFLKRSSRQKQCCFGHWWEKWNRTTGRLVPQLHHASEWQAESFNDISLLRVIWRWSEACKWTTTHPFERQSFERQTTCSLVTNDKRSVVQPPVSRFWFSFFHRIFT